MTEHGRAVSPIADAASHSRFPLNKSHVFGRFRIASFGAIDPRSWSAMS
jgi:hypothetical protein